MNKPKWFKWLPVISLIVSVCSFIFAVSILYPWHIELSREFTQLSKKIVACK